MVLPLRGAAALDSRPRKGLGRKTSVSQLQDVQTCVAWYPGREDVYHEFDCAGALGLLQKEVALLRVQFGPTETAHGFGDTVSCPAMGVRRRDAGRPLTPSGSQQDHVDHDTCVLTTRALQGAVLDLAVVPSDVKPHVVVSALENAVLHDDRVGVQWVVADNASPALHATLSWSFSPLRGVALDTCHLPMKYEAVASHHGSAGSRMLRRLVSKFNVCPDVDALEPFRGEPNRQLTRCSSTTICVTRHCPGSTLMSQSTA